MKIPQIPAILKNPFTYALLAALITLSVGLSYWYKYSEETTVEEEVATRSIATGVTVAAIVLLFGFAVAYSWHGRRLAGYQKI